MAPSTVPDDADGPLGMGRTMVAPSTLPHDASGPLGMRTRTDPLMEPEAQKPASGKSKLVAAAVAKYETKKAAPVANEYVAQDITESREPADIIDLTDTVEMESELPEAPEESSWVPSCFDCGATAKEAAIEETENEDAIREQPEVEAREESPESEQVVKESPESVQVVKESDTKESEATKPPPGIWAWLTAVIDPQPDGLPPVVSVNGSATVDLVDAADAPVEKVEMVATSEPVTVLIPVVTIRPVSENLDDASTSGGTTKLLGDLQSLAETKDDVTFTGTTLQTEDLGCRDDGSSAHERSLVEAAATAAVSNLSEHVELAKGEEVIQERDLSKETRRLLLVKDLRKAIATHGRYDLRVADISAALGDLLSESKEHEQALKLHRDAAAIYSAKKGDDDTATINAKTRLGQILEDSGHYDEAINTYYGVMVMQRALKGEEDPSAGDSLVNMANALRRKGDYTQATKELKRALKIFRESLGDSHEKVSSTVDAIASLYVTIGDFEKSAAILEEVVKLKAATMGMKSDAVAVTLISLATTYECSEGFDKAMKCLKKAYKIYTELGGYSSDKATATLNRIAQLYEAMGDHNRASIAYLGVLRGRKINLGNDHLQVGEIYYKLGHSLRETGQLEKALKCMKEALPIYVGKGVEMYDVEMIAEVMHEMAVIYQEKKNFKEASRVYKQELTVRRKIGQPEFPLIARTLNLLGVVEYEMENHSHALKYLVESLTVFQQRGEHGIDCAEVLFSTGLVFQAVENNDRARDAFAESVRIYMDRGCYTEDHPFIVKANEKLAELSN